MNQTQHDVFQQKRTDILGAATELFAAQGFHRTSTRQISVQARVSERTLFKHFPAKEDLWRELIDMFVVHLGGSSGHGTFAELLRDTALISVDDWYMRLMLDRRSLLRANPHAPAILLQELVSAGDPSLLRDLIRLVFVPSLRAIRSFQRRGALRDDVPARAIQTMVFPANLGLLAEAIRTGMDDTTFERRVGQQLAMLLQGLGTAARHIGP